MINFNHNIKHSIDEWRDYFNEIKPDLSYLPVVLEDNMHARAWLVYIGIKYRKKLVIVNDDFSRRFLEEVSTNPEYLPCPC